MTFDFRIRREGCKISVSYYVQAIGAIGIVYELAPPSLGDLTHLAVSGLVDSLNEVWGEGTDLVSVTRELGLYWGHTFYVRSRRLHMPIR